MLTFNDRESWGEFESYLHSRRKRGISLILSKFPKLSLHLNQTMQIGSAISYFLYKMKRRKSSDTSNRQRLCNTTTQPIRARAYMWLKFYSMNHWRQFQTKSRSPRVNERNCLQKISPISTLLFKISSVRKVPFFAFFFYKGKRWKQNHESRSTLCLLQRRVLSFFIQGCSKRKL